MNQVGIAYLTKDRPELSVRTIEPLLEHTRYDVWWIDGSDTKAGEEFPWTFRGKVHSIHSNVRGGADAAIVYALSTLYDAGYQFIGLAENDVLLPRDWFESTMPLFDHQRISVGAVSARAYEDRVLIQRDGYAVMHNLGAGHVIFRREVVPLILDHYRTGWTTTNRRVFAQRCGLDIGAWWAFRGGQHWLTADWHFDTILAAHGYASLALTPSEVEMIGQDPPLEEQGLRIAREPVEALRNEDAWARLCNPIDTRTIPLGQAASLDGGTQIFFAHQVVSLDGGIHGEWTCKWVQGFGPFAYVSGYTRQKEDLPRIDMSISGTCAILLSSKTGGHIRITAENGYDATLQVQANADVLRFLVPAAIAYRRITVSMLDPDIVFHGIEVHEPQPTAPFSFRHSSLPPVAGAAR